MMTTHVGGQVADTPKRPPRRTHKFGTAVCPFCQRKFDKQRKWHVFDTQYCRVMYWQEENRKAVEAAKQRAGAARDLEHRAMELEAKERELKQREQAILAAEKTAKTFTPKKKH